MNENESKNSLPETWDDEPTRVVSTEPVIIEKEINVAAPNEIAPQTTVIDRDIIVDEKTGTTKAAETIVVEKNPVPSRLSYWRSRINSIGGANRSRFELGATEIVPLVVSSFLVISVVALYFLWYDPLVRKNQAMDRERDRYKSELQTLVGQIGTDRPVQELRQELVTSIENFEGAYLVPRVKGQTDLYESLNRLIHQNGLRNSSGPDYSPLELKNPNSAQNNEEKGGKNRLQSIYPGTFVSMTVEGDYANLRNFIRDIEQTRQFIVISAVELEPSDNSSNTESENRQNRTTAPNTVRTAPTPSMAIPGEPTADDMNGFGGIVKMPNAAENTENSGTAVRRDAERAAKKKRGEIVSLKLELASYYRRENIAASTTAQ